MFLKWSLNAYWMIIPLSWIHVSLCLILSQAKHSHHNYAKDTLPAGLEVEVMGQLLKVNWNPFSLFPLGQSPERWIKFDKPSVSLASVHDIFWTLSEATGPYNLVLYWLDALSRFPTSVVESEEPTGAQRQELYKALDTAGDAMINCNSTALFFDQSRVTTNELLIYSWAQAAIVFHAIMCLLTGYVCLALQTVAATRCNVFRTSTPYSVLIKQNLTRDTAWTADLTAQQTMQ